MGWYRLTASHKLEWELAMIMPAMSPVPAVKVGGIDKDNAPMPTGLEAMGKAMKACKGIKPVKGRRQLRWASS